MNLPEGRWSGAPNEYIFRVCPNVRCGKEWHFYYNVGKSVGYCHVCHYTLGSRDRSFGEGYLSVEEPLNLSNLDLVGEEYNAWFDYDARVYLISKGVSQQQCFEVPLTYRPDLGALFVKLAKLSPEYPDRYLKRYFKFDGAKWIISGKGWKRSKYIFDVRSTYRTNVLVCEGIFDLLSSGLEDLGIALLGTAVSKLFLTKFSFSNIFLWLDPDEGGYQATEQIGQLLDNWGIKWYDLTNLIDCEPKNASKRIIEKVRHLIETHN